MSKQIKLGFDRVPSPKGTFREPLFDILTGEPLTSQSEVPLKTIVERDIAQFKTSRNATPVVVNNSPSLLDGGSLKVEERFPEFSEVSNTLLGVPRAETQLSLFSDVSSLGLDEANWIVDSYSESDLVSNQQWYRRRHPIYGARTPGDFYEHTTEGALSLRAFPVPYSFPYGPDYEPIGLYNKTLFDQYIKFIAAGRVLYDMYYNEGFENFAQRNFLPPNIKIVQQNNEEIPFVSINNAGQFQGLGLAHDIEYDIPEGVEEQEVFDQIEKWTLAWQQLLNEELSWPDADFQKLNRVRNVIDGILLAQFEIRPGYNDNDRTWATLSSKQTFRYQPGRISGFTFGSRFKNDPSSPDVSVEWGISNDTDEYLYQLKGADFNIVRRSTVPLSDDLIERMGLDPQSQKQISQMPGQRGNGNDVFYELTIPRDLFNKDALTGNGPSGYNVDFTNVTMWKIEFGWYGAIGAKFYAYVPVGNQECRWVLMHNMIIENGIDKPCLANPNFRFKYLLDIIKTSRLKEPVYAYKYGSSTYIDGGDEGTMRVFSTRSDLKAFNIESPILNIFPKKYIINRDSIGINNEKKGYPTSLRVSSSENAIIKFRNVNGSTEGFHFHYSPSIVAGRSPATRNLKMQVSDDREAISIIEPNEFFSNASAHLIADGLWNVYTGEISIDGTTTVINRRNDNLEILPRKLSDKIFVNALQTGIDPARQVYDVTINEYNTIVASDVTINTTLFKLHFLNPIPEDLEKFGHSADYFIAITDQKPQLVDIDAPDLGDPAELGIEAAPDAQQVLRFGPNKEKWNPDKAALLEWATTTEQRDPLKGWESNEFYGYQEEPFEFSSLFKNIGIPNIKEEYGGKISGAVGQVLVSEFFILDIDAIDIDQGTYTIRFANRQLAPDISDSIAESGIAELGFDGDPTGIKIISGVYEISVEDSLPQYGIDINITGDLGGFFPRISSNKQFQLRAVVLSDNYDINERNQSGVRISEPNSRQAKYYGAWNILPVYLVMGLRDGSQINCPVVEEIYQQGRETHTPNLLTTGYTFEVDAQGFITETRVPTIQTPKGATLNDEPVSFNSIADKSSLQSDSQLTQPLRPGEVIFTAFCGADESVDIDLSSIYGPDRNAIVPNKYNTTALFITAETVKSIDSEGDIQRSAAGSIQMSLTVKEQS